MRIDPKYFNRFIFIAALFAAGLIVLFTWWNYQSREQIFRQRLTKMADTLRYYHLPVVSEEDSIQISSFKGQWVLLDFWASWAPPSRQSHHILNRLKKRYRNQLIVISAASQDPIEEIKAYKRKHSYPFIFVNGRSLYRDLNPPGVPTQIIFTPKGKIKDTIVGYHDSTQYAKLKSWLKNTIPDSIK